jgi:hypothetical protein
MYMFVIVCARIREKKKRDTEGGSSKEGEVQVWAAFQFVWLPAPKFRNALSLSLLCVTPTLAAINVQVSSLKNERVKCPSRCHES